MNNRKFNRSNLEILLDEYNEKLKAEVNYYIAQLSDSFLDKIFEVYHKERKYE